MDEPVIEDQPVSVPGVVVLREHSAVGSGVEWLRRQRDDATPVVVLARSELLRTGNGSEYPPRLDVPLPRGAEVRRLFERAGWYQVQLSGGPVGWLPRDAVVGPSEPEA